MEDAQYKDTVIRLRVTQAFKARFNNMCNQKAINPSELLRQLIAQWMQEQQDASIAHKRTLDI